MAKRTTHRSSKGTKLYAVRDKEGRFKDIQTYKRAHAADLRTKARPRRRRNSARLSRPASTKLETRPIYPPGPETNGAPRCCRSGAARRAG